MFRKHKTIDDVRSTDAVKEIRENGEDKYRLYARPYGNAVLFNTVVESENIQLGNVTTLDGELVLNLTDIE